LGDLFIYPFYSNRIFLSEISGTGVKNNADNKVVIRGISEISEFGGEFSEISEFGGEFSEISEFSEFSDIFGEDFGDFGDFGVSEKISEISEIFGTRGEFS